MRRVMASRSFTAVSEMQTREVRSRMRRPLAATLTRMRSANLALRFGLELAALAGLAVWGLNATGGVRGSGWRSPRLACGCGRLGAFRSAPKAARRLPLGAPRVAVEAAVFGLAAWAGGARLTGQGVVGERFRSSFVAVS